MRRRELPTFGAGQEAAFQTWVLKTARASGWLAVHLYPIRPIPGGRYVAASSAQGFPDLVLVRERLLFAELKCGKRKLDPEQLVWVEALRAAGGEVHVWRGEETAEVKALLRGARSPGRLFATGAPA